MPGRCRCRCTLSCTLFGVVSVVVAVVAVILGWMESEALRQGRGYQVPESLIGKNVLITGASSGIGYSAAVLFCKLHANVMLHGPSLERTRRAAQELRLAAPGACKAVAIGAELDDYQQVHKLADETRRIFGKVHFLILNAGLHYGGPVKKGPAGDYQKKRLLSHNASYFKSKQGHDRVMEVNHFGHFLLTALLWQDLAMGARIVVMVGGGMWTADWRRVVPHTRIPWEKFRLRGEGAYYDSKLANVCFARALRRRLAGRAAVMIHDPGLIVTGMTVQRGSAIYAKRRFGETEPDRNWWGWSMSADQSGERLVRSAFATRPVPDVIYNYWLPTLLMRPVQDHNLIPKKRFLRSKILNRFLRIQRLTFGPVYAGIGPGCGDTRFLDFFWNYSMVNTGLGKYTNPELVRQYRQTYLANAIPNELKQR